MLQKPYIIFEIKPKVINPVFQHGCPLYSHPEGIARIFFRIDAAGIKNIWINHTTSQQLEPSCTLAYVASFAAADVATYIHLGRGLGKREK